jgi:ribosomal protein L14E/L6E/L27E
MDEAKKPKLGQIVKERFVWTADGDKRKFDQPKKKNLSHLELLDEISSEVVESMMENGRVTNGKLRYALNRFGDRPEDVQEKGE